MSASAPPPAPTVAGDRWPDLAVPALGAWTPTRSVSVVVVARPGEPLEPLLATLGRQTYPADLLDVVVVAAGADVARSPLGDAVTVATPKPGEQPEAAGVRSGDGEIVCFLAPVAPVDGTTVEAHARWHHAASGLATLGWLDEGGWLDRYRERTAELSVPAPDHFRALDLRGVGVPRALLDGVGGVRSLGDAALASLDLGWRLWCAGTLFVPEPFTASPPATGDGRPPRSPRLVPPDRRLTAPLPDGAVPAVLAHVPAGGASSAAVRVTVRALLASDAPGVAVRVEGPAGSLGDLDDPRVTVGDTPPVWTPASTQIWVPPSVVCAPQTLRLLAGELSTGEVGAVSITVPELPPARGTVVAAATRALSRARRVMEADGDGGADGGGDRPAAGLVETVDRLFGHRWIGGERVGIAHWRPDRPVVLGDVPPGERIDTAVARQLARRLDEADRELDAARARAHRLDGERRDLRRRLATARKQVADRDRRLARARSAEDELRLRTSTADRRASTAERRASAAERRAAALARRRVVRAADALGRLLRARRPGTAIAALRDLARVLRA